MTSQVDTIINAVLDEIEAGKLTPGKIIDEARLIAQYNVSRTPLREAYIQLEAMGLVTRNGRKGARIFKPTLEEFLAILEVHAKLEGQAAGLAARRLSPVFYDKLEQVTRSCEEHAAVLGDAEPDRYYQLNMAYHARVAEAAGNPFLLEMIKTNARKLMAYYRARYHYKGAIADSARDHRRITTLISERDSDAAEAAMAKHVQFDQVTAMDLLAALG